jgi:hypothetical protein
MLDEKPLDALLVDHPLESRSLWLLGCSQDSRHDQGAHSGLRRAEAGGRPAGRQPLIHMKRIGDFSEIFSQEFNT